MYAFRSAHEARDAKKELDLRDEAGERVIAGRRAGIRAITEAELRREVIRDLDALLNTVSLDSAIEIGAAEPTSGSILNFGRPDLARRSMNETTAAAIAEELRESLIRYEPRLVPASIRVRHETDKETEQKLRFVVTADLSCDPLDVAVEFVADVSCDSGAVALGRL
ncbi:MAG TPA: type VI secretion system baseplate subunit TssE [Hyphomicrobiales bacterium]|nr:type VI secretion system baseplate subunit TssE [Hyphomicrobiales bacterium]